MAKILFIEGVSGVGKSTMVHALTEKLRQNGYKVQSYPEFDYTNPIDFYATAYVPTAKFENLCRQFPAEESALRQNGMSAGEAVLVRYANEDTPLFGEALMQLFREMEFCYHPKRLVPLEKCTAAYKSVWERFEKDRYVLEQVVKTYRMYDITDGGWDTVLADIQTQIQP